MRYRDELTLTRAEVIATLDGGCDWQTAADRLRIPAGLVFMIATGIPADGSGVPQLPIVSAAALPPPSPQQLINDRKHNPVRNDHVDAWMRARAQQELTQ